jgi:hypothetical protein
VGELAPGFVDDGGLDRGGADVEPEKQPVDFADSRLS